MEALLPDHLRHPPILYYTNKNMSPMSHWKSLLTNLGIFSIYWQHILLQPGKTKKLSNYSAYSSYKSPLLSFTLKIYKIPTQCSQIFATGQAIVPITIKENTGSCV